MIRGAATWAIGQALKSSGDEMVAIRNAGACDPLLRSLVQRRVRRAVHDAMLAEREDASDRVVLLMALLSIAEPGREWGSVSVKDLEAAHALMTLRRPIWWMTVLVSALAGLIVVVLSLLVYRAVVGQGDYDPSRTASTQGVAAAYATGGKPRSAGAVGDAVFHRLFPDYVVALGRWSSVGAGEQAKKEFVAPAEGALLSDDVLAAVGDKVFAALRGVVNASANAVKGDAEGLMTSLRALNDSLAETGLAYYVDGDVLFRDNGQYHVMLYCFDVDEVRLYAASTGQRERVLHLRRADDLNWERALMGFTREGAGEALVLVSKVENQLVRVILPALPMDGEIDLFHDKGTEPWKHAVGLRAAEVVRAEFLALVPSDEKARELGALVTRRKQVLEGWREELGRSGWHVPIADSYRLDLSAYARIEGRVSPDEFTELGEIDRRMGAAEFAPVFAPVYAETIATVERHEVQHRLDYARQPRLPFPEGLEKWTGPLMVMGKESEVARRTAFELSALLSELARDQQTLFTNLTFVAQFLLSRNEWGSPYSYAAAMIFQGLASELNLEGAHGLDHGFNREAGARLYERLSRVEAERLRGAARRLWQRYFGLELPQLRLERNDSP